MKKLLSASRAHEYRPNYGQKYHLAGQWVYPTAIVAWAISAYVVITWYMSIVPHFK